MHASSPDLLIQQIQQLSAAATWGLAICCALALASLAAFLIRPSTAALGAAGLAVMAALPIGLVEEGREALQRVQLESMLRASCPGGPPVARVISSGAWPDSCPHSPPASLASRRAG